MGVNVWFWGPPAWRLLFAVMKIAMIAVHDVRSKLEGGVELSDQDRQRRHGAALWAFRTVQSFVTCAPCPHCRGSSLTFLKEIQSEYGEQPLMALFLQGFGLEVLYKLRQKVNMKLHTQHLREYGVTNVHFEKTSCSVPTRGIRWQTFLDRLMLTRETFHVEDVLTVLQALRLDFAPEFAASYKQFFICISVLVNKYCSTVLSHVAVLHHPMQTLQSLMNPIAQQLRNEANIHEGILARRRSMQMLVLNIMCGVSGEPLTAENKEAMECKYLKPYDVMAVGVVCANYTCARK